MQPALIAKALAGCLAQVCSQDRVAGHKNPVPGDPFTNKVGTTPPGIGHENIAAVINDPPVHFLRDTVIEDKAKGTKTEFKKGQLVPTFGMLGDDGSTSSGNWVMAGSFDANGLNKMAKRGKDDPTGLGLYPNWSYAWPVNRRIIYNRCSCDAAGNPYNADKVLVKWDGTKWLRNDVPDFGFQVVAADGTATPTPPAKTLSFMMTNETVAKLYAPAPMKEGPFPEHYEPFESPLTNALSGQQNNPAVTVVESAQKTLGTPDKYPIVMTTFRLTEHWQTGGLTRNLPWLVETMPKMFVEISKELAEEKGIVSGDNVVIENNRGAITAYAMVTGRIKPLTSGGQKIHQIAAPWHWGYGSTCSVGGMANDLTPNVGDANTHIPEYKTFLVDIRKQEV